MKNILKFAIISLAFSGCNSKTDEAEKVDAITQSQKVQGKNFFDYDEIVYYFNDFDESKLQELSDNQSRSEIDSIKIGVVVGDIPSQISDSFFIDKLEKIGYNKSYVDKSNFRGIDKIFIEKLVKENVATACIHFYRDILIFKKQNKIIGTAKICFACMANQIKGTTASTENFGQDGDYGRLKEILRK